MYCSKILYSFLLLAANVAGLVHRSDSERFTLYAYGDGIGGLPIFAQGDYAYIGNGSNLSNSTPVFFTNNDDSSWTAGANTTDSTKTPPFEKAASYIPGPTSSTKRAGFVESGDSAPSGAKTDGFMTYGNFVMHKSDSGSLETLWYAVASDVESVWSLNWNTTGADADGGIPLTLKTNPPSNGAGPTPPSRP